MKEKFSSEEWGRDFQEFLNSEEIQPPKKLSNQILKYVHRDLNPTRISVLSKLTLIHGFVGTVTLLFCPYSELFTFKGASLMNVLMQFGEQVCMLGCGAAFLGGSALAASLILRQEEVQVIRKERFLQLSIVALLSMSLFICTGLLFLQGLALFWILGSVLGGVISLELGWALRRWIQNPNAAS